MKYQIKSNGIQSNHPAEVVSAGTSTPLVLLCKTQPGKFHPHHIPPAIPMTFVLYSHYGY